MRVRGDCLHTLPVFSASGGQVLVVEGVVVVLEVVVVRQELSNSSSQHCAFIKRWHRQT